MILKNRNLVDRLFFIVFFTALLIMCVALYKKTISIFVVKSESMHPSVKKHSLVVVKPLKNYDVGDIITYKKDNFFITHRVVSIKNSNKLKTKGDSNEIADLNLVSLNNVVGKVIITIPYFEFIISSYFVGTVFILVGGYFTYSFLLNKK